MNRQKRIFGLVTAILIIVMLQMNLSVKAEEIQNWAKPGLDHAVENDIMKGDSKGNLNPTSNMTRAELITMVNRVLGLKDKADLSGYKDVSDGKWYYDEIAKSVKAGIIEGDGKNLRPEDTITREETFAIMSRIYDISSKKSKVNHDASEWSKEAVNGLLEKNFIKGDLNGNLNLKNNITRAEFATMLKNITPKLITTAGNHKGETIKGNVVVNAKNINLEKMVIEGDLILAEGMGASDIVLKDVIVLGKIITRSGKEIKLEGTSKVNEIKIPKNLKEIKISVDKDSKVKSIDSSSKVEITGKGKVDNVVLNKGADSSVVDIKGAKLDKDKDLKSIKDNTKKSTDTSSNSSSSSSSGGGGGGSSSGSNTDSGNNETPKPDPKPEEKDSITINPDKDGKATITGNYKTVILEGKFTEVVVNTKSDFELKIPENHIGEIDVIIGNDIIETGRIKIAKGTQNISIILDEKYGKVTITKDGFKMGDVKTEYTGVIEFDIRDTEGNPIEDFEISMRHFDKVVGDFVEDYAVNSKKNVFYMSTGYYQFEIKATGYFGPGMTDEFEIKELSSLLREIELEKLPVIEPYMHFQQAVINLNKLENITLENEADVKKARSLYDELDELQKEKVENKYIEKLKEFEDEISKLEAEVKWNQILEYSKDYKYDPVYNYNYNKFEISGDVAELEYKDITVENAKVVMNDLARYLGAMYRVDNGATVKSIEYNNTKYTWSTDPKELIGSNWRNETSTLIKAITNDFLTNKELRELNLKLVGEFGVEKTVTIKGKLVTEPAPIEPDLEILKVENTFEISDVKDIRFMVKSITNNGLGTGAQKIATLDEVNTHFNNNYKVKNGYKLEVELVENNLVLRTYMTEELFKAIKAKEGAVEGTPYRITVLSKENKENKILKLAYIKDNVELEELKKEAEAKMNKILSASKYYKYIPEYKYSYESMEIKDDNVELEYKDITVENAKVVMNDLARYLGAMYRVDNGKTVKSIEYNGEIYTWNGELKGSNWKNKTSTLIKAITNDFKLNEELRELNLKLVGEFGVEKNVIIKGKLVTEPAPIEPDLEILKVENTFEISDVENIRFMVKSITNNGSGTGAQKIATLDDVNTHFNNNYDVKNGYKLEAELVENNLVLRTYMTEELFDEIKAKGGASPITPYRITVLSKENKENKILKIAYTKEKIELEKITVAKVKNEEQLKAAVENKNIETIEFVNDIKISEKINITSNKIIDGKKNSLSGTKNQEWSGFYLLHFYKTKGAVKNIKLLDADAGIYVNGSDVTVSDVEISNMGFGGIEVSKGKDVSENPTLKFDSITFIGKDIPAIWIDNYSNIGDVALEYTGSGSDGFERSHIKNVGDVDKDQLWLTNNKIVSDDIIKFQKVVEVEHELIKQDNVKFLVAGLTEEGRERQVPSSLDEVKNHLDGTYKVNFNANAIEIIDKKISISERILSPSDWKLIKGESGDINRPYRITIVLNNERELKLAKIAMYEDGLVEIENLNLDIQAKSNKYLSDVEEDRKMIDKYNRLPDELKDEKTNQAIKELDEKIKEIDEIVDNFMIRLNEAIADNDFETGKELLKEFSDDMRYDAKEVIVNSEEKLVKVMEFAKKIKNNESNENGTDI